MDWLDHWRTFLGAAGAGGGLVGVWRLFPRLFRGLAELLAARVLLEIEREKNRAREEQVADLLAEIEEYRKRKSDG